jgi:hypothetical protein
MNKLKTKYNALAQCKLERLSLSIALLAIYQPLCTNDEINREFIIDTNI